MGIRTQTIKNHNTLYRSDQNDPPAEIPYKNSSISAELPPKTLPARPSYLVSFPLYCSFPVNTGGLKCIIMTKHLALTPNLKTQSKGPVPIKLKLKVKLI